MDYTTMLVLNGPTIITHKGWQKPANQHGKADTVLSLPYDISGTTGILQSSNEDTPDAGKFLFVNATKSVRAHSPKVMKLVKRHVRNASVREARTEGSVRKFKKRKTKLRVVASKPEMLAEKEGIQFMDTTNFATEHCPGPLRIFVCSDDV